MSDNENGLSVSVSSASSRRTSSESLEDSIRKILNTGDGRVTGFLESHDLSLTCKQLGLEDNGVRDIIAQLGSENHGGLVSLEQLRQQVSKGHEKSKVTANISKDDMSAKKMNEKSSGKESWEIDSGLSGAHDLHADPTLQQIMSVANSNSKGQSRSSNFLELANTLHLAALASLKTEIVELTGKVQQLSEEKDQLQASLACAGQERKELIHDYEDRLTSQAQHSEQHITELQSVIAELNKKLSQASVDKFDESEEHEIESQTSEHGSQSESDSLASEEGANDDNTDDELSKVVGGLEFAIDRQNTDTKVEEKKPAVETVETQEEKITDDTEKKPLHKLQSLAKPGVDAEKTAKEHEDLQSKCRELRVQCLDLEKKKQLLERQLQQTSLKEWVSRKKSSGSTGTPDELQSVTSERDGLKAKLKKSELDLEQMKTENQGFREERDRLRRRVLEMQDQLKLLHQKSLQYEQQARTRANSLQGPGTQPRSPGTPRRNTQPSSSQSGARMHTRQASIGASSDVSGKEGFLTSPRISRRSSTDNLSIHSHGRGSQSTPNGQVRRPSITGTVWTSPDGSPALPLRHPSGSVQSISSQAFWRPGATSDLGSSMHGSTQEITVVAKMVDDGTQIQNGAITGVNCIRALSQLPEFVSGKMPSDLVQALESCKTVQDVFKALFIYCDTQADKKLKEYELEIEMLTSRYDHLQAQSNVISLSLEESRNNADRMSVLMGKYESNSTALQLALNFSDRVIETYEVLLQLSEAEQARLFANCRAAGVKTGLHSYASTSPDSPYRLIYSEEAEAEDNDRVPEDVESCVNRRRTAENEARSLLQKLDRNFESQNGGGQPWDSVSSNSRTSSTGSSNDMEFTPEEEVRLKSYIQKLKSERSMVGQTVIELESLHEVAQPKDLEPLDPKVDLENAVLMQELMALKEEKAELKAKNYLVEKEKRALELKITSRDAQEHAYLVHIEHLKTEMQDEIRRRRRLQKDAGVASSKSDEKSGGSPSGTPSITLAELKTSDEDIPPDLYEAARREKKLKARIQELVETLESLSKNSETRHQQTAEYVADLKKANGALVAAYEKAKKKHGARLRKLEQQMITMVERHDAQVRTMKERISLLEEELKATTARQNETAL